VWGRGEGATGKPLQPGCQSKRNIRRKMERRGVEGITLLGHSHQKRGEGVVGAAH